MALQKPKKESSDGQPIDPELVWEQRDLDLNWKTEPYLADFRGFLIQEYKILQALITKN